jgi:hypothetical protein
MTAAPTVREKLEAALGALPLLDDQQHHIARMAAQLLLFARLSAVNDLPWARKIGAAQASKELQQLLRLAGKLNVHLCSLHRTSLNELERDGKVRHWRDLAGDLEDLCLAANEACTRLAKEPREIKADGRPKTAGGAPKKSQAELVTAQAAKSTDI